MNERFHYRYMRMIAGSILLFASILLGSGCCKNPADNDEPDTVTDIDGNEYSIVKIGDQWWMAENLKVTHYRNGDEVPNVTDVAAWNALTTGALCSQNNDANNITTYGLLYNWFAVNDSRGIAPEGWHVPTDAEWQTLVDYLGGEAVAGGKMKEAGTAHWESPNTGATNESGFTALPGGCRYTGISNFYYFLSGAYFWSNTVYNTEFAYSRMALYDYQDLFRYGDDKQDGFSVRCIKD